MTRWQVAVYSNNDVLIRTVTVWAKSDDAAVHAVVLKSIRGAAYYHVRML